MLKTSSTKSAEPKKGVVGVGVDSRARCNRSELDGGGIDNVEINSNKIRDNEVGKKG